MVVKMDAGPRPGGNGKSTAEKKGTPTQRQTQADMHRWSRTNNATVKEHGADGRAGV